MKIILEREFEREGGLKAHGRRYSREGQVKRHITSGGRMILHRQSEDILTSNVFGILEKLDPVIWIKPLLTNHFGETIIQLPDSVLNDEKAKTLDLRYVIQNNWTEIQTTDAHSTIELLLKNNISLSQLRLREWSLEDLFIALTGKQLRH